MSAGEVTSLDPPAPPPLRIEFTQPLYVGPATLDRDHLLFGAEATLRIVCNGWLWLSSEHFPMVEFRYAIDRWMHSPSAWRGEYRFISADNSEELEQLMFVPAPDAGYRLHSWEQLYVEPTEWSVEQLTTQLLHFIGAVDAWVRDMWGVDTMSLIEGH